MQSRLITVLVLCGIPASAHAQTLYRFGNAVRGVSDDGQTAVGTITDFDTFRNSITWTPQGGVNRIGLDPVLTGRNTAEVISGDGSTVFVGVRSGANPGLFRYLGPGQALRILNTTGYSSFGITESAYDGRSGAAVAIDGGFDPPSQAARWTASGGIQLLGYTRGGGQSYATGSSRDGSTIVGWSRLNDFGDAFWWSESSGMHILPSLDGTADETSQAQAVSSSGRFIVGMSGSENTAVIWRDGVIDALGDIPGYAQSIATSVSDDGSVVVGTIGLSTSRFAFVWTEARGMELMSDYFARLGVLMPEGLLFDTNCKVGADGRTFYGSAGVAGESNSGFVVTVPTPATLTCLLGCLFSVSRRQRIM